MNTIKRFIKYLWYVIKNIFVLICFALDIIGVLLVYLTDLVIPSWVYIAVLLIGFILANYMIYVDNAPEITVNTSLLSKYPYKVRNVGDSYVNLMVNYNLYIQNPSNNAGVVEKIGVELVGFSKCKDDFLLNRVGVKYKEFFIADEELFTPLEFMKHKIETKFPIIMEPKALIKKVLILYIDIEGDNEQDYKNTIEWMSDLEFLVKITVKNNNVEKENKYKIRVSKSDIENERIRVKKQDEDLKEYFEGLDS